jgi:regulator of replication initiation timing
MYAANDACETEEVIQGSQSLDNGRDGFSDGFHVCNVHADAEYSVLGKVFG